MIAALMASTDGSLDSTPTYVDLARAEASIERTVDSVACTRLVGQCISLEPLRTRVAFGFDEHKRIRAHADVSGSCTLACQLCLEPRPWRFAVSFKALLATDESQAQRWIDESTQTSPVDVVVIQNAELDLVEIVEDEIMLRLPSQVCEEADCARRPQLDYGGNDVEAAMQKQAKPFADLEKLKKGD